MRIGIWSGALTGFFLTGCVSYYALPVDVPKAKVTFSSYLQEVRVYTFEDDTCARNPYGARLAYFYMKFGDPLSGVEKEILADKEFVFTFNQRSGLTANTYGYHCTVTLAFTPKANARYKSHFESNRNQCVATLFRVVDTGEGEQLLREKSTRQVRPDCVNNISG